MIVRKLRMQKGLSQELLAEMAGISPRTLQRIERGTSANPETLKCIAAVLETDFNSLRKEPEMPTTTEEIFPKLDNEEREAMEYVRDIKSFYFHALLCAAVITGLAIINLTTSPGHLWFFWPALGWGIGIFFHGLSVFEVINPFGNDWERRQIEKRLRRR